MRRLASGALILFTVCGLMIAGCGSDEKATIQTATEGVAGLYPVSVDGKWGYIDDTGAIRIQPQFHYADDFSEGLAMVSVVEDGVMKYGYIDPSGTLVIQPQFGEAGSFSDGMAAVGTDTTDGNRRYGYIDRSGTVVIPMEYDGEFQGSALFAPRFSKGLCAVKVTVDIPAQAVTSLVGERQGSAYGYMDKTGSMVIAAQFDDAGDFSEGLAAATSGDISGFIDAGGEWVIKLPVDLMLSPMRRGSDRNFDSFSEGLAIVRQVPSIDPNAPPREGDLHLFSYGYIDNTGRLAIEPRFVDALSFSDGLAAVCVEESGTKKWGYIDKEGDWVIEPRFDYAGRFSEGLATVALSESHDLSNYADARCSVIDKTGKVVITLQRGQFAHEFSGGVSKVDVHSDGANTAPSTAYIDTTGRVIWQGK